MSVSTVAQKGTLCPENSDNRANAIGTRTIEYATCSCFRVCLIQFEGICRILTGYLDGGEQ